MSSYVTETRPVPNLKEFSEEERRALGMRCYELSAAGYKEEADRLSLEYPLSPEMADALKSLSGVDALVASGMNLSRAIKEYGNGWLES